MYKHDYGCNSDPNNRLCELCSNLNIISFYNITFIILIVRFIFLNIQRNMRNESPAMQHKVIPIAFKVSLFRRLSGIFSLNSLKIKIINIRLRFIRFSNKEYTKKSN